MRPSLRWERELWRQGYQSVAGVDEVGRGAWAGPIVAAAVIVPREHIAKLTRQPWWGKVRDSKALAPKVRIEIARAARPFITYSIARVESSVIDKFGIGPTNLRVVQLAVKRLAEQPDFVLADFVAGLGLAVAGVPARAVVGGDARIASIALASIIAKVERDSIMVALDAQYPGYGFSKHKGYGTAQHRLRLARLGPCPAHRRSYRPVANALVY